MLKVTLIAFCLLFLSLFWFSQTARAEEIHFDKDVFVLKKMTPAIDRNGYDNEYFFKNEDSNYWTKMVGIYYYPDENSPLKFAANKDKEIESQDTNVLLKFIENKKEDKAAISFLQNGSINGKNYFEYNILKYEKHPDEGMMELRYAIRYFFKNDSEIMQIGNKVKEENDKFLQLIVSSPIPPIVKQDPQN